jgi:fructokinase
MSLYGGIEAGGTKFVCAVGSDPEHILSETTIPTTKSNETIERVVEFFLKAQEEGTITAIGLGSFGPLDLNKASPFFGYIRNTPKPGWANTGIAGKIGEALRVPILFNTDANVAALGEATWGNGQGFDPLLYLTVGTGIGGGIIIHGKPLHGLIHPEMGHMRVPHDWKKDSFPGACAYHGDCLEGLASGPALHQRWGIPAELLPSNHEAWILEAQYIATGLTNLICTISPKRIILGGGVMQRTEVLGSVRGKIRELLNDYFEHKLFHEDIAEYVTPPKLGKRSGVLGAIALARKVFES